MAERTEIVIESRLGQRTVSPDRVIRFPKGLIGFPEHKRFTLLQIKESSPFLLLQSLDDPGFGLVVADPFSYLKAFEVSVSDSEQRLLMAGSAADLLVLVTVTIPKTRPQDTTLNLSGPICINVAARIGLQIPQIDPRYPSHHRLGLDEGGQS